MLKIFCSQARWHVPIVPATGEAEVGGSPGIHGQPGQYSKLYLKK